jgi:hypothetical protein
VIYPDFEEFVGCLNVRKVKYLLVGAYAVAFHARPRATKDIDVLVEPTATNARRVRAALADFLGTPAPNVTVQKLTNPRTLIVLGVAPVRIDLLTTIDGVPSFAAAWRRRVRAKFGQKDANYLSLEDLIEAKAATSRLQDKADLVHLRRALRRRSRR